MSENLWFRSMLGIDVGAPPLPEQETRNGFVRRYAEDSGKRLDLLRGKSDQWWEEATAFFEVRRSRAWIMVRRIAHTAHHRGQQTALLRMLRRNVYSTYGPTADTGGLPANQAPTIYAFPDREYAARWNRWWREITVARPGRLGTDRASQPVGGRPSCSVGAQRVRRIGVARACGREPGSGECRDHQEERNGEKVSGSEGATS